MKITDIKPGDRVRFVDNPAYGPPPKHQIHEVVQVVEVDQHYVTLVEPPFSDDEGDTWQATWNPDWFEPIPADAEIALPTTPVVRDPEPLDVLVLDVWPEVTHDYDFKRGDERFFDRDKAIAKATERFYSRHCRQQVRIDSPALNDGPPLWLVQDI